VLFYEIDFKTVLDVKKTILDSQAVNQKNVSLVPMDLNGDLLKQLVDAGIDLEKKTLFVMEGIIYNIHEQTFLNILTTFEKFPAGSMIVGDYNKVSVSHQSFLLKIAKFFLYLVEPLTLEFSDFEAYMAEHSKSIKVVENLPPTNSKYPRGIDYLYLFKVKK